MSEYKILMADDEPDILDIMAKNVARAGYQVIKARDGEEAWDMVQMEHPDVIVLDLTMPKKDGFSVLKDLREKPPAGKWIPVIIVSALGEVRDVQKGMSLEADHYLTKPCRVDDILRAIRMMLSLAQQRDPDPDS